MLELIDTHAHVNFSAFQDEYKEVLQRAKDAGVLVVNVGTQLDTSREAVRIAEENNLYAVVGLHPVHTYSQHVDEEESHFKTREETFDYGAYKTLGGNARVVGIGECGLDYYRLKIEDTGVKIEEVKQLQKQAFVAQIKLAQELHKTLVIHCRPSEGSMDAYIDILKILDEETKEYASAPGYQPMRFEIHSFTGTSEIVQEFLKRGAYVGVNGIITFDKTGNMEQVVKAIPLDRIVLETDSPYLAPVPYRGKKNEPSFIRFVGEKVAEIKGIGLEEVARQTSENAQRLFTLPRQFLGL